MKTIASILILASLALTLPACNSTQRQAAATGVSSTANTASTAISALPPALVAKVKALAVKYPTAVKYADATAKALNVAATSLDKLPTPAVLHTFLLWGELDPQIAPYLAELEQVYAEFYPALSSSTNTLTQLAALVQTTGA